MNSLKRFLPVLSSVFVNLSEHALYERQRVLVRAGLLEPVAGRGPGSGVPLTSANVAMLMVAILATDNLSEVSEATKILLGGIRIKTQGSRGLLPGANNLHAAIAKAIGSDAEDSRILRVKVNRTQPSAAVYVHAAPSSPVLFLSTAKPGGNFSVESSFHGDTFVELRRIMTSPETPSAAQQRLVRNRLSRLSASEGEASK